MVAFIVLHYYNFEDTQECVSSIQNLKGEKKIIVVDNNSLAVQEKVEIKEMVDDVIFLKENIGFAKANNKGIEYARKKYNPDFVVVLNNDILINQTKFIELVRKNYEKYNFDMLGPKIISPGDSVNPFPCLKTPNDVLKEIHYVKKLIVCYQNLILYLLLKMYVSIKKVFKKAQKLENGKSLEKNIALHGCGIIFSKKYLEKYVDPFYKKTFLFHEEDFLYQRIIKDNLISIYDPSIVIYHEEGSSMKKNYRNERKKKLFREKERLKSLELLKQYMEEYDK